MIIINNNKKHKNKLIDTWNRLVVARGRGAKWVKGIKRYRLPVIK